MNPHKDHRGRVKTRFHSEGLDSFAEHNALELLLFYAIPQKDTNELAHALLDKFGNIAGVFNAEISELMKVDGIGEHAATLLKLMPQMARRYFLECGDTEGQAQTADGLGKMFVNKFVGETNEVVYLTMLDNSMRIIETVRIFDGSVNSAHVTPRMLLEPCVIRKAAVAVIAHNHPMGLAIPSGEDIYTTRNLETALQTVGIPLLEHYIIAGNHYTPLMYRTKGMMRQNPDAKAFYAGVDTSSFYSNIDDSDIPKYER